MTLFLDSSALARRYVRDPFRRALVEAMADDPVWCASALARTEVLLALHRLSEGSRTQAELWASVREDWAAMTIVPVDERCLGRAVELGARFRLTTVDAVHLAAADRLPRPVTYATLDRRQLPAAAMLDFEVLTPYEE
ncbi:MAG: type II toxin-antitoxin system VapC family toxin [Actinomycetota bacterium]